MANDAWSNFGAALPSSWMSAPKPLQPGDYGYTPPGMVSYAGEPPHPPSTNSYPTASAAPDYNQQVNALYASIGKTPDLIDQQGRDYWGARMAAGEDVTSAFNQSAGTTYRNMVNGQSSPYAAQNAQGFSNAQDMMRAGDSNLQSIMEGSGMSPGQIGVFDNNHPDLYYQRQAGGTGAGGGGGPSLQSYTQSPYLAQMGEGLRTQFTGFMNDGLAADRGEAVAAGGVGGSRQGLEQSRTRVEAGNGFNSALANLYGNDYQQQMGRNLQKYQADQNFSLGNRGLDLGFQNSNNSYNLGLGGLDLQSRGQDMSFYNTNRQLDQSGALLGANLYNLGMQGPWNSLNNANGLASPYASNGTQTTNVSSGGGAMGALGGALGTAQLWNNITKNSGSNGSWWG